MYNCTDNNTTIKRPKNHRLLKIGDIDVYISKTKEEDDYFPKNTIYVSVVIDGRNSTCLGGYQWEYYFFPVERLSLTKADKENIKKGVIEILFNTRKKMHKVIEEMYDLVLKKDLEDELSSETQQFLCDGNIF